MPRTFDNIELSLLVAFEETFRAVTRGLAPDER
jgi:hypothetical protein